jgi:hypothetical protein
MEQKLLFNIRHQEDNGLKLHSPYCFSFISPIIKTFLWIVKKRKKLLNPCHFVIIADPQYAIPNVLVISITKKDIGTNY